MQLAGGYITLRGDAATDEELIEMPDSYYSFLYKDERPSYIKHYIKRNDLKTSGRYLTFDMPRDGIVFNSKSNTWGWAAFDKGVTVQMIGVLKTVDDNYGSPTETYNYLFALGDYTYILIRSLDKSRDKRTIIRHRSSAAGGGSLAAGGASSAAAAGGGSSAAAPAGVFRNRNSFIPAKAAPLNSTFGVMGGPPRLTFGPITGRSLSGNPFAEAGAGKRGGARNPKKISKKKGSKSRKQQKKEKSRKNQKSRKSQKSRNHH